jgi:hypothetical protein
LQLFRKAAVATPQNELIDNYQFIKELSSTKANNFVEQQGLTKLNQDYFRYCFWATTFAQVAEANALFYLESLLPLVIKTYVADFSHTYEKITAGFEQNIDIDKVINLRKISDNKFVAHTEGGREITANNVVIATPYHNASQFYTVPHPHLAKPASVFYVRGKRASKYQKKKFILLNPEKSSIGLIWYQEDVKMDLIFSLSELPELAEFYHEYEIVKKVTWKTAVVLSDDKWVEMVLDHNLFLAGDYNICGLEDSFISGVCAANQILAQDS